MVVQPDLTYRLNLWMLQQPFQTFKSPRIEFGSIVRMNAHSGEDERISVSQADCGFEIGRSLARSDREHVLDAGFPCAFNHGFAVGLKLLVVKVTVRIRELHRYVSRAPIGTSSLKPASTGGPPS